MSRINNRITNRISLLLILSMLAWSLPSFVFAEDSVQEPVTDSTELATESAEPTVESAVQATESAELQEETSWEDLYKSYGLPVFNICGSIDGVSRESKSEISIEYSSETLSFKSNCSFKLQGHSSLQYPKKNYSIQFLKDNGDKNKIKLVDAWGKQSKYCLKANYVDYSQSRNIVSARIFNEILKSRNIDDELNSLSNGGLVDGYPVVVCVNGEFHGLYTMNIPKDKWMFGMKDETKLQAILMGDYWTNSVMLKEAIADTTNPEDSGWEMEYCSTEDDETKGISWVGESMNSFIQFIVNNNGESFKDGIGEFTDVDRAIDVLIYTYFIDARDNTAKNIIWVSYDGKKWIPSMYDMDATWGMSWYGSFDQSNRYFDKSRQNLLFDRLLEKYPNEIKARYFELRGSLLSKEHIEEQFSSFTASIPDSVYSAEAEKWTSEPSISKNNLEQIKDFTAVRTEFMDGWFGDTANYTKDFAVEKHTHKWNAGKITRKASCTRTGIKKYSCTFDGCKSTKTTTLKKKSHYYIKKVAKKYLKSKATRKSRARYYKSCKYCGKKSKSYFYYGKKRK